ncbi:MAG: hypothetical protein WKI04_00045 [Ferruginibacter sp.]
MDTDTNKKKDMFSDCEKATLLVEQEQFETLSSEDTLYMTIHLDGCLVCRTYRVQSKEINNTISRIFKNAPVFIRLDETYKQKLRAKINEAVNNT